MKKQIERIKQLSDLPGVSGFEDDVVRFVREDWQKIGDTHTDSLKNLYVELPKNSWDRPLIQLDAHSDEVGLIVQAIKPNGLIQFLPVGGWIPSNLAAQKVKIRNSSGEYISGIITSKPPHFMTEAERAQGVSIQSLAIDVGASSKEEVLTNYGVTIGSPVVPDVECSFNERNGLFTGKAFDCRIGVACLMEVLAELASDELRDAAYDVVGTLTSQEEVGLRGAEVAAKRVKPDLAIVFEGCPADDTSVDEFLVQSALNKGSMLRYFDVSMITNPEWQQYALDIAKEHQIPVQVSVRSGGGTNGAAITRYNGAPAIVVGIPVRYAHTHHCYVSLDDYLAAKKLVLALLRSLTESRLNHLLHPLD